MFKGLTARRLYKSIGVSESCESLAQHISLQKRAKLILHYIGVRRILDRYTDSVGL
jgi:hypothetical protein